MDKSKIRFVTQHYINGKFVDAVNKETFEVINPADETIIAHVQKGSKEDIDIAVAAARQAFENGPWATMGPTARANLLYRLADLIEKNADELAAVESINNGKTFLIAKHLDVDATAKCFRYYAGWVDKIRGQTIPVDGPLSVSTRKVPVGVVGQVIPWNFPLLMQAWKLAPALAAGCTIVMKTAEQTPLSGLRIAELIHEAGFPPGVVNIISGFGNVGAHLVRHPGVDKVAFTGSTEVGYDIMKNSHDKNLKRITLELGGKSANIITKNADFEVALQQSCSSLFFNAGQCCNAGSRTFVHSSIYDKYVQEVAKIVAKIKLGDPFDPTTEQGPQISEEQMNRILSYIEQGKKEGARLVLGGNRWGNKGFYIEPTVFADVKDDFIIAKEEIFGPVHCILKYDDIDDVIKRANNSNYGLAAGVVSQDHVEINYIVKRLRAGQIYVNTYGAVSCQTPFGGFRDSGIGRELGEEGLNNYLELKCIIEKI